MSRKVLFFILLLFESCHGNCPEDWLQIEGKCFLFVTDELDYAGATQRCLDEGGRLFEPKNGAANNLVGTQLFQTPFWIGINDQNDEGNFVFESSGARIKYQNWALGQPDNGKSNDSSIPHDCVAVHNQEWIDEDCNVTRSFVCEDLQDGLDLWSACLPGWNLINGKCYRQIDATMKFDAAFEVCKTLGGQVFEPRYEQQEQVVRDFYRKRIIWLGITDRENEGSFTYASTKSPIGYSNWNSSDFISAQSNCVILNDTIWQNIDCDCGDIAIPICEEETVLCPDEPGWKVINGRCFYFSTERVKYWRARNDCYDKGGRLFEPRTQNGNNRIFQEVSRQFWLGINSQNVDRDIVYTSTEEALTYEQWAENEPERAGKKDNCILVKDKKGNWGDKNCNAKRNYVCERPYSFNPYWDLIIIDDQDRDLLDYVHDTIFDQIECNVKQDGDGSDDDGGVPPLALEKHFLVFGGLSTTGSLLDGVYLVDINSRESCQHSQLPVAMKEAHIFEYNGTILVCSAATSASTSNLQCFIWSDLPGWETFETPASNGINGFISAVRVPGVGLWFIDNNLNTLTLNETSGEWIMGYHWTNFRQRACAVRYTDTKVAHLGGTPAATGQTIDTYDFATDTETLNVTQMLFDRKQFSCALIPQGATGNPTVAILGDNSPPYPYVMELWDTVTNEITTVPHPSGYDETRFFRPSIATYDETSILFATSKTYTISGEFFTLDMYLYRVGIGWVNLGVAPPPMDNAEQVGIYLLDNPDLPAMSTLNQCAV